ncbi:MAG: oligopeptide/dipeptide ABC transporter ATP-binding protein [Myxococcota bacterium]
MALLLISHDLAVVSENCSRVVVMYGGRVVEAGPVDTVFSRPRHPYTDGLLRSLPERGTLGERLHTIRGTVPAAHEWPSGCRFRDRCPRASDACVEVPSETDGVWCWHPLESSDG